MVRFVHLFYDLRIVHIRVFYFAWCPTFLTIILCLFAVIFTWLC